MMFMKETSSKTMMKTKKMMRISILKKKKKDLECRISPNSKKMTRKKVN